MTILSGGAARYNEAPIAPDEGALVDAIMAAALDAAARNETEVPVADARLSKACTALVGAAGVDGNIPYPVVEFALQSNGIIEPRPAVVVTSSAGKPAEIADAMRPFLATLLAEGFTRIGVGIGPRDPVGHARVVVAMQATHLTTTPIPRSVDVGAGVAFDVVLRPGYEDAKVAVTRPSGASEFIDVRRTSPSNFSVRFDCGDTRGKAQFEIVGRYETLATFPMWCGVDPPTSFTFDTRLNDTPNDPLEAERQMLELINRDRQRVGAAALVPDDALAEIAREHSREMRRTGIVSQVLATKDSVDAIVRATYPSVTVQTSVARGPGIGDIHDGLVGSPSFQVRMTSTSMTHIGIGIAYAALPMTGRNVLITVVFADAPLKNERMVQLLMPDPLTTKCAPVSPGRSRRQCSLYSPSRESSGNTSSVNPPARDNVNPPRTSARTRSTR